MEDFLSQQKIMIATPCYGGMVFEHYARSLASFAVQAKDQGMDVNMATIINESLITRARNELVTYFVNSNCTHLFFIDADIIFSPSDVFRLIQRDVDVVAGVYPMKAIKWDRIAGTTVGSIQDIKNITGDYAVNFNEHSIVRSPEDGMIHIKIDNGLAEVKHAGTGFMCIKRHVIEKVIDEFPNISYLREMEMFPGDTKARWAVFDTMIDDETGVYLSEDYAFCKRWSSIGGKIFIDSKIKLGHAGTHIFDGHLFA